MPALGEPGAFRGIQSADALHQDRRHPGPGVERPDTLERLIAAGLDIARLNFAHGDAEEHAGRVDRLRTAAERVGREVAVLCDIPGPKLRIGPVEGGHTELHTGSRVVLTVDGVPGTAERLPVDWKGLPELMKVGDVAYLADGSIRLRVVDAGETEVVTEVEVGGFLASRQGINLPERHHIAAGRLRRGPGPARRGGQDGRGHGGPELRPPARGPRAGAQRT